MGHLEIARQRGEATLRSALVELGLDPDSCLTPVTGLMPRCELLGSPVHVGFWLTDPFQVDVDHFSELFWIGLDDVDHPAYGLRASLEGVLRSPLEIRRRWFRSSLTWHDPTGRRLRRSSFNIPPDGPRREIVPPIIDTLRG